MTTKAPPRTEARNETPAATNQTPATESTETANPKIFQFQKTSHLFSRLESRSLSELTRQIAPPTKNGHAPPPTESRKSSQSVNPSSVRAW